MQPKRWQEMGIVAGLMVLALASGAAAQQAADAEKENPQPTAEEIRKLVADLESPKVRQVMSAQWRLMEIGRPALRPLLELGKKTRSRGVRVRIMMLGKEIIKRAKEPALPEKVDDRFPWTEPEAGIAMRLSLDRERYKPGQVVNLRVDFKNVDDKPRSFAPLTRINLPRSSGFGAEGHLKPGKADAAKRPVRDYKKRPLERQLAPGQVVTWWFRLNEKLSGQYKVMLMHDQLNNQRAGLALPPINSIDMPLPVGDSEVRFAYFAASRGLLPGAQADLAASVTVTVAKPAPTDKPAPGR